jgi:putative membrane protein
VLAAAAAPLVLRTVFLSLRDRIGEHRRIARWTLPIWMYVSVTGVVVYVMLYHLAPNAR